MGNCLSTCCRDSEHKGYERIPGDSHESRPEVCSTGDGTVGVQQPCMGAEAEAFQTHQDPDQEVKENEPEYEDNENRFRPTIQEQPARHHSTEDDKKNTEQAKEEDNQSVDITENEPERLNVGESQQKVENENRQEKLGEQAHGHGASETAGKERRGSTIVCCSDDSFTSTANGLRVRNLHVFKVDVVIKTHNNDNTENEPPAAGPGEGESARNQEDRDDEPEVETETESWTGDTTEGNECLETGHVHVHECQTVQMEACSTTLHVHMEQPELQYITDQEHLNETVKDVLLAKVLWKGEQELKYKQKYKEEKRRGMNYAAWCQAEMSRMEEELEEDKRRGEQQLKEAQKQGQERIKAITEQLMERLTVCESRRTESEQERVRIMEQLTREQKEVGERMAQLDKRLQTEQRDKERELAALRDHYEEEQKKEQEKVMTFVLQLENRDQHLLQDLATRQLTEEHLSEMVTRLYVDHNIRLLGVDCGLTFLMEAPEAQWVRIVENQLQIQTTVSQLLSEEVREVAAWSEITQCSDTEDIDIRLGQPLPTDLCMETDSYQWSFSGEGAPAFLSSLSPASDVALESIPVNMLRVIGDKLNEELHERMLVKAQQIDNTDDIPETSVDPEAQQIDNTDAIPETSVDLEAQQIDNTDVIPETSINLEAQQINNTDDIPETSVDPEPAEFEREGDGTEFLDVSANRQPAELEREGDGTEFLDVSANRQPAELEHEGDGTKFLDVSANRQPAELEREGDDTEFIDVSANRQIISDGSTAFPVSRHRYAYDVYIASSDDTSMMGDLVNFERDTGLRCFICARDVFPGTMKTQSIFKNMDSSRALLFIFDATFLEDECLNLELSYGMKISEERKTPVVIIRADDTPDSEFNRDARAAMRLYPCLNLRDAQMSSSASRSFWTRVRQELLKDKSRPKMLGRLMNVFL